MDSETINLKAWQFVPTTATELYHYIIKNYAFFGLHGVTFMHTYVHIFAFISVLLKV